ncbi:MAG: protease inhibitor I42 family protein [Nitrospiraceae bacterium]
MGTGQASGKSETDAMTRVVTSRPGASVIVNLWEDRTRGEQWVPTFDRTALSLVADDYLRIASNNAVDTGQRTFEFSVVRSGRHRILFEKRMGWKFTAEDRRVFVVDAGDPASGA